MEKILEVFCRVFGHDHTYNHGEQICSVCGNVKEDDE